MFDLENILYVKSLCINRYGSVAYQSVPYHHSNFMEKQGLFHLKFWRFKNTIEQFLCSDLYWGLQMAAKVMLVRVRRCLHLKL